MSQTYLVQMSEAELEAACRLVEDPGGGPSFRDWQSPAPGLHIGHNGTGQFNCSGPLPIGNPNKPWFEVTPEAGKDQIIAELGAPESGLMREMLATHADLRALYRAAQRPLIRDESSRIVGCMPAFTISNIHPRSAFLAGEAAENLPEFVDLAQ